MRKKTEAPSEKKWELVIAAKIPTNSVTQPLHLGKAFFLADGWRMVSCLLARVSISERGDIRFTAETTEEILMPTSVKYLGKEYVFVCDEKKPQLESGLITICGKLQNFW